MGMISNDIISVTRSYVGIERRSNKERRLRMGRRSNIRFDGSGGDRRSVMGRRGDDIGLKLLE